LITRRDLLGGATGAALARRAPAKTRDRRPNLLFLIADDHAGYVLGAQGNTLARTPVLDQFAAEGTRFARHHCNSPVCTPSRQSILTSQLPHAAGVTVLETPLARDRPTLAGQLLASAYSTAVLGKMHFNAPGEPGLHGFQLARTEDVVQKEWSQWAGPVPDLGGIPTKPVWRPFRDPARIWLNADKLPFPRHYEQMKSTWVANQAVRYLETHKDDAFALWVSFSEPHSPFDFPVEDRADFDPAAFPVPTVGPEDAGQIPLIFRDLTPAEKQGIISAYYTSVHYLDRHVGVVLAALRRLKLEDHTLVVYMADHGYSLGQHGRFEKHCCYDPALQVPLMMRWPGHIRRGAVVREFTESIDVPPTILELLGAERFTVNHGHSLRPYLTGGRGLQPRQSIFSEYLENEEACVRTARWKYIHSSGRRLRTDGYRTDNPTPGRTVRLFDLRGDPGEFHNVAGRYPEVVAALSAEMLARFRATHPDAAREPAGLATADAIEWYLPPRDAKSKAPPA
jgi:choline-sulfatase